MRLPALLPRVLMTVAAAALFGASVTPTPLPAQVVQRSAVGVADHPAATVVRQADRASPMRVGVADTTRSRRSALPYVLGGALAGALVGGLVAKGFDDDFCGDPQPGTTCSSTGTMGGVVIGAGVGLLAGWLVWAMTAQGEQAPQ